MGELRQVQPVLLVVAVFSRHQEARQWARARTEQAWGLVALESPSFAFDQTEYYSPSMGGGLQKQFFAFADPADPGELAAYKLQTNAWEAEYAAAHGHPESRPLNLDPGYVTPAKLVLASTKDFAHRIYLGRGIYAEVTLQYRHGAWHPLPWTFPDYREPEYHEFFSKCREYLARRLQASRASPVP